MCTFNFCFGCKHTTCNGWWVVFPNPFIYSFVKGTTKHFKTLTPFDLLPQHQIGSRAILLTLQDFLCFGMFGFELDIMSYTWVTATEDQILNLRKKWQVSVKTQISQILSSQTQTSQIWQVKGVPYRKKQNGLISF